MKALTSAQIKVIEAARAVIQENIDASMAPITKAEAEAQRAALNAIFPLDQLVVAHQMLVAVQAQEVQA